MAAPALSLPTQHCARYESDFSSELADLETESSTNESSASVQPAFTRSNSLPGPSCLSSPSKRRGYARADSRIRFLDDVPESPAVPPQLHEEPAECDEATPSDASEPTSSQTSQGLSRKLSRKNSLNNSRVVDGRQHSTEVDHDDIAANLAQGGAAVTEVCLYDAETLDDFTPEEKALIGHGGFMQSLMYALSSVVACICCCD